MKKKMFVAMSLAGFFVFASCGGSPLDVCTQIQQERCYDADKNGEPETVQICDGEHWETSMDCSEQWDAEGNPVNDVCAMSKEEANCVKR